MNDALESARDNVAELEKAVAAESPEQPPESTEVKPAKKKKKKKKSSSGGLGSSRGIETMFRTSYRVHMDLSSLADSKANIMISINGLILSILLASISPKLDSNPWLLIPTTFMLVTCLVSIVYSILAARPRVSSQHVSLEDVRADRKNVLFFGNFANMDESDFQTGMTELMQDTDRLYHNMIRDLYGLGSVLVKKFQLLRIAYTVFMIGITISVLSFIGTFILEATTV